MNTLGIDGKYPEAGGRKLASRLSRTLVLKLKTEMNYSNNELHLIIFIYIGRLSLVLDR